jgi:hypothetical protein
VLGRIGANVAPVGEDQLGRDDVVDRQAVLAHEEADPAGGRQPADADATVVAGAHRQPVPAKCGRDVGPARAGAEADATRRAVQQLDPVERAHVDHDAAVVGRAPADAVPAAADRERHVLLAREPERRDDVLGVLRPDHQAGAATADVGGAHLAVVAVAGLDRLGGKRRRERVVVDPLGTLGQRRRAAGRPDRRAGGAALARHGLPQRGRDLLPEHLDRLGVVAAEDERAEPVLEHQAEQLLDPLLGRPLQQPAARRAERPAHVEQPPDLARIAPGGLRGLVDPAVRRAELLGRQVRERRQPAVGLAAREPEHARLVGAEPDADVVRRRGPALGAAHPVVRAGDADAAALADVPDPADDVDRLAQRVDGLAGREPPAAHRLDPVPERAGAEPELHAPAGAAAG